MACGPTLFKGNHMIADELNESGRQSCTLANSPADAAQAHSSQSVAHDASATCPDCGGPMRYDTRDPRRLDCPRCGSGQTIDVLRPTAAARQREFLHDRGTDRLRAAIRGT